MSKPKSKTREKTLHKYSLPSDDESIATLESEIIENPVKRVIKTKWSSTESVNKISQKIIGKVKSSEEKYLGDEKMALRRRRRTEATKEKNRATDDMKPTTKSKKIQKQQINDLSVNDESYGIFVAPCSFQTESAPPSRKSLKIVKDLTQKHKEQIAKEKVKNLNEEKHSCQKACEIPRQSSAKQKPDALFLQEKDKSAEDKNNYCLDEVSKEAKIKKEEKNVNSKIPKPKQDIPFKPSNEEDSGLICSQEIKVDDHSKSLIKTEEKPASENLAEKFLPERDENLLKLESRSIAIKEKAKKWQNISEMPTEDLLHISEDFDMPNDDNCQDLSESAIWAIAAEQFLKSEESIQSTSITSIDSLNENFSKKPLVVNGSEKTGGKSNILRVILSNHFC